MKSHFPLVTQQATTELWSGEAPTRKLSPCPRCLCPSSPRLPPRIPSPGRRQLWGPAAAFAAPRVIPSLMLCFIRLTAATPTSKTRGQNNKEIRRTEAYLLPPLFVCNLGKKPNQPTHPDLPLYLLYQLFPLLTSFQAGLGKRATGASLFAFISQQF